MAYDGQFAIDDAVQGFLKRRPALFIDGQWTPSAGGEVIEVHDPATGLVIATVADATVEDVNRAVLSGRKAFEDGRWRHLRPADRERVLLRLAEKLEQHAEELAQLETLEQGKSINLSRMIEVGASVEWTRYAAGLATKLTGRTFDVSLPGGPLHWTTYTRREPIGVVAGIAPWNFPLMIALWKVLPALASGCSIVLKPSEVTPLTALRVAEIAAEAGVPPGVLNVITGTGKTAGRALVEHPAIAKITFTGSTQTGKDIARSAVQHLTRTTLELGGKNPAIVLRDADVDAVVNGLMLGGFLNGGQVCAAASRVYVEAPLFDALASRMHDAIKGMRVGPGLDPQAQVNPLVSRQHQQSVLAHLTDARKHGGELLEGAAAQDERGYYVRPTLVLNPRAPIQLVSEEVFGPVLSLTRVADADEAVRLANESRFGLAASLWTRDLGAAMNCTPRIEAGTVWINSHVLIDPNMPFGGIKQSGQGRDFGVDWLEPYTELKSVCFHH